MHKTRHYFQQYPLICWLTTTAATVTLIVVGGLIVHEINWPLLIVFSVGVPSTTFALKLSCDNTAIASRLVEEVIAEGLSGDYLVDDPDDLTDEQIAEVRAGIDRGLKAAAAEGHVKPLAQVAAEARQRHGFPATWASGIGE